MADAETSDTVRVKVEPVSAVDAGSDSKSDADSESDAETEVEDENDMSIDAGRASSSAVATLSLRPRYDGETVETLDVVLFRSTESAQRGRDWFATLREKTLPLSESEWNTMIASASKGSLRMPRMDYYDGSVLWQQPTNGFITYFRHADIAPYATPIPRNLPDVWKDRAWESVREWLQSINGGASDSVYPLAREVFQANERLCMNALMALQSLVSSPLVAMLAQVYMEQAWVLESEHIRRGSYETVLGHHALILIYALSNGSVRSRGEGYRLHVPGVSGAEEARQWTEWLIALLALHRARVPAEVASLPPIRALLNTDRVLLGHSYQPFLVVFVSLVNKDPEHAVVYNRSLSACVAMITNAIARLCSLPSLASLLSGVPLLTLPTPKIACPRCGCNDWNDADGKCYFVGAATGAAELTLESPKEAEHLMWNVLARIAAVRAPDDLVLSCTRTAECAARPSEMLAFQRCLRPPVYVAVSADRSYFSKASFAVDFANAEVNDTALSGETARYRILSIVVGLGTSSYRIVRRDARRREYYVATVDANSGSGFVSRASTEDTYRHPFDALGPLPESGVWSACVVFERHE